MKAEAQESADRMPPGTTALHIHHVAHSHFNGLENGAANPPRKSSPEMSSVSDTNSAPKPFKKRYLAEQNNVHASSETNSATPTPPISPVGADTARACEALLELSGRKESECRARSPAGDGVAANGIDSKIALRKAVWRSVVETASKQKECAPEKLSDGENSVNKGTIRGQQIIDHIIENLLVKGTSSDVESSKNSLNNNADSDPGPDNSDRIKASIYESLKNDLLKEKNHSGTKPGDLPFKNLHVGRARVKRGGEETAVAARTPLADQSTAAPAAVLRIPTVEPSNSADIMRLVSQNLACPVSLGQTSVTITRTPRTQVNSTPVSFPEPHLVTWAAPVSAATPLVSLHSPTVIVQPRGVLLSQPASLAHSNRTLITHVSTDSGLLMTSSAPTSGQNSGSGGILVTSSDCGAVNLILKNPEQAEEEEEGEEGRRSSRTCKGKRYQEFIENGRIAVGNRKRRSHRSEEESEEETALNLSSDSGAQAETSNHWKKKQLRQAEPVNRLAEQTNGDWTRLSSRAAENPDKAFSAGSSSAGESLYGARSRRRRLSQISTTLS